MIDARDNTERLVRIVDHLLSLARLEQGREPIALKPEATAELRRAAAARIQPMIGDKRLILDIDPATPLPHLAADAHRLGLALDNLLVNAATYTGAGGQITLSARPVEGGKVGIAIRDTGIGIAPEHLPHVFDKFFRIPGQTRGQGTGLGLAIVKEVVTAHGGEITCESELGARERQRRLREPTRAVPRAHPSAAARPAEGLSRVRVGCRQDVYLLDRKRQDRKSGGEASGSERVMVCVSSRSP